MSLFLQSFIGGSICSIIGIVTGLLIARNRATKDINRDTPRDEHMGAA